MAVHKGFEQFVLEYLLFFMQQKTMQSRRAEWYWAEYQSFECWIFGRSLWYFKQLMECIFTITIKTDEGEKRLWWL